MLKNIRVFLLLSSGTDENFPIYDNTLYLNILSVIYVHTPTHTHTHTHLVCIDGPEMMKLEVLHIPLGCWFQPIVVLVTNNMVNTVQQDRGPAIKVLIIFSRQKFMLKGGKTY